MVQSAEPPISLIVALIASLLAGCNASATAAEEDRVQLWQYRAEEPTKSLWLDPDIQSVQWKDGDLEVLFTLSAPCGWTPVGPNWTVRGHKVELRFTWSGNVSGTPAIALCKKFVRAWVFRVPRDKYEVSISKEVPRFAQRDGKVVILAEPN